MENKKHELFYGRLGVDPKLSYTKMSLPVCELSIGVTDDENKTVWKKVVVFGVMAELCHVHLKKGQEVFVRGQNKTREYTNKDGEQKIVNEITASFVAVAVGH
ncbi:MAG: single-stranded DNA-binding protein [Bacteriovoracaceae bacterium]|nr:single-stranded DNA-binding protein [Bacteriovoracaceae bacterium]